MDNYNTKQILDLSSFFVMEFSDDSEADLNSSIPAAAVSVEDNDDAQSSCNDSSGNGWDYSNPDHYETELYSDHGNAYQDCTDSVAKRAWEEYYEEEEGEVNMSARIRQSNSKACIHDGERYQQQPASEVEKKNKMFWESCLASGF